MRDEYFVKNIAIPAGVALLTVLIVCGTVYLWAKYNPHVFSGMIDSLLLQGRDTGDTTPSAPLYSFETIVVSAVEKANPAVVAITISKDVPVYERYFETIPGPFGDFFGFTVPFYRQYGTEEQEIGGGSGFLVSSDGYIVTNQHVVADENAEYTVFLNDGTSYEAEVIARDETLDLAVIKIEGSGFSYLPFADSDTLQVGQSVIAIGNALAEFRNTVSLGIVSGLARSIVASDLEGNTESLEELIQTDAAINRGNSGGPLLNLLGEVVGVNVAVATGAENIGFAVSGNSVKAIVESVQETGRIVRPFLGIRYIPITRDLAEQNNLPVEYGVWVQRGLQPDDLAVIPDSPAEKAGIEENDIILEIDGRKLANDTSLSSIIRTKRVGESIELKILRDTQEQSLTATLEEASRN